MSTTNTERTWVLWPFERVGPVVLGTWRTEIREILRGSHRLSELPAHRRVPEDKFMAAGEGIVTVEYDDEDRVLAAHVALRPVTLPGGPRLVGVPADEAIGHLRENGHRVRSEGGHVEVPDLGLRLWARVGAQSPIASVVARRRDYRDALAAMSAENPGDAAPVRTTVRCVVCAAPAATAEVLPPGRYPAAWDAWPAWQQETFWKYRPRGHWWWIYAGPGGSNGTGDAVSPDRGRHLAHAFIEPINYHKLRGTGLYDLAGFCRHCEQPYCPHHWRITASGAGWCPRGHGQSLDPHWSPDD